MHVSRGVFLKTCGLALMSPGINTGVLKAAADAFEDAPMAGGDVYLGQILLVPFNFAPVGFAFCNGQLLPIGSNTALFSLLGTTYGGNGSSTFALPDLRGITPISSGQGLGLTDRSIGETAGTETHTLTAGAFPAHTHVVSSTLVATARCKNGAGTASSPMAAVPAVEGASTAPTYGDGAADVAAQTGTYQLGGIASMAAAGGGQPHSNMPPYLTLNYIIAIQGVFPPRS